jgi:hypothetical protein
MVNVDPMHVADSAEEERAEELQELQDAASLLLATAGRDRWRPRELQARARNGHRPDMISLAFWQLLNDGKLVLDRDLRVRRAAGR